MTTDPKTIKGVRFPRSFIDEIVETRIPIMGRRMFVGGSYIRGLSTLGDIDIAVEVDKRTDSALKWILSSDPRNRVIVSGPKMCRYSCWFGGPYPVQVDIWLVNDWKAWGPTCMYVAGDGRFNIIQRARAKKQGFKLEFYLRDIENDGIIPVATETEVYAFLGWEWIAYESRSLLPK
jgi:DNA polymerase/3'-5' exonuclease PolX